MDHGKIRDAHKEDLIKGDAKIIDGANPKRIEILYEFGDNPVQAIKVTQDAIYDLHDKCAVTPIKSLSEMVKGMLRLALHVQDIVQTRNGRKP